MGNASTRLFPALWAIQTDLRCCRNPYVCPQQRQPGNPWESLGCAESIQLLLREPGEGRPPPDARARLWSPARLPSLSMAAQGHSSPLRTRPTSPSSVWPVLSFSFVPLEILAVKVPDCPYMWVYRVWSVVAVLSLGLANKRLLNMASKKQFLNLWMCNTFFNQVFFSRAVVRRVEICLEETC